MTKIFIPILNSQIKIAKRILKDDYVFYLDDSIEIKKLTNEEYGAIAQIDPNYETYLKRDMIFFVCTIVETINKTSSIPNELSTKIKYIFNAFREKGESSLDLLFAILLNGNSTEVVELGYKEISQYRNNKYKTRDGMTWQTIRETYDLLTKACLKHKKLYLTINKYNSSFDRRRVDDKIIDLTICLESTIQDDKNELAFKFSLFNTYASGYKLEVDRNQTFDILKKLYNTRSTIVHGGSDESKTQQLIDETSEKLAEIEDVTVRIINNIIFYLKKEDFKNWTKFITKNIIEGNINIEEQLIE